MIENKKKTNKQTKNLYPIQHWKPRHPVDTIRVEQNYYDIFFLIDINLQ